MRPQEPSVPPFRTTGPGGTTRPDAAGPFGSDGHGGRTPSHARPEDDDPYGDVPVPPPTGHGHGNGMHAPYGASGWTGSDRYAPTPAAGPNPHGPDPLGPDGHGPTAHRSGGLGAANGSLGAGAAAPGPYGNGSSGNGAHGDGAHGNGAHGNGTWGAGSPGSAGNGHPGPYGNGHPDQYGNGHPGPYGNGHPRPYGNGSSGSGSHGNGAAGSAPHGAGPSTPAQPPHPPSPPQPPHGPGRGGPPWTAAAAPPPFGVPRPDGGAPGAEPAGPPAPPAYGAPVHGAGRSPASPPGGTAPPDPRPAPAAAASGEATSSTPTASSGTSAAASSSTPDTSSPSPADGGLAGADGFASRPPRAARDGATTTGTTSSTATTGDTTRTTGAGVGPGRHRRGAGTGPGRDDEDAPDGGEDADDAGGRASRRAGRGGDKGKGKAKRKGSFWRELPLLIVVAVVLTFVIQTFLARIYVIPSASMERTLHGCSGCANDRVAVDKVTYRFSDPAPGDVVVFRGPPAWGDNGEVSNSQRSDNVLVRGLQSGLSLVGLAPPDEKDFVKRVIAVGGQTVACCDPQNRVTVDGVPLTEPYIYYQPNLGRTQADFPPVQVPQGQLWVMGDNRNNSADARVHGPIGITDVIGKARVIVLPVGRWGGVPDTDPQAQPSALGAPAWTSAAPVAAGVVGAVPLVVVSRRWRRSLHGGVDGPVPAAGGPAPPPSPGDPDR